MLLYNSSCNHLVPVAVILISVAYVQINWVAAILSAAFISKLKMSALFDFGDSNA